MGIRYYAYPVPADLGQLAEVSPRDFIADDPLADAWGPPAQRPPMLYLDKCWRHLQFVLGGSRSEEKRAAYELVRGEVTMRATGWDPFVRYLEPESVREISLDLATLDDCQVMDGVAAMRRNLPIDDYAAEVDYTIGYLNAAIAFTREVSLAGHGLAYQIG